MRCFEDLCRDNYERIYKYIFAKTGSREASEDLIQDVFTIAFEKGTTFTAHDNPTAFLYTTARNVTLSFLRRERRIHLELLDEYTPGTDDVLTQLETDRDRRIDEDDYVDQVLGRLDDAQRDLYVQRYVDRQPIRAIADAHGIAEPAMRMRLVRLRRDIQGIVRDLELNAF